MAELVGQHQQSTFVNPVNGTTGDADQVRQNDNDLRSTTNTHDADSGIHFQSGPHASRPAAGTAGRKWFSNDTKRLYYDNGSTWGEANYLALVTAGEVAGPLLISGGALTVATGGITVTAGGLTVTAGNFIMSGGQAKAVRNDAGDSGTSKTLDFNTGNVQKVRMTGSCTFTFSNPQVGAGYIVELLQDATGNRFATWPSTVKWDGGATPVLTTTANRKDVFVFLWNGTNYIGSTFAMNVQDTT